MESFQIYIRRGDQNALSTLIELLHTHFNKLPKQWIAGDTYIEDEIKFVKITCRFRVDAASHSRKKEAIRKAVSRSIAEFIVDYKEDEVLKEIFKQEQRGLEEAQRQRVLEYIEMFRMGGNERDKKIKVNWIAEQTQKYFQTETSLFIEGYIRFRLKKYWDDLHRLIEFAKDEYVIEKELGGYIETLKESVSNRKAKLEQLHVIHFDDRNLYLYDQEWRRLYPYLVNGIGLRLAGRETNYEDLVVSVIVSLAPKVVLIHTTQENYHIIFTIKKIFSTRATVCSDCNDCRRRMDAR